MNIHRKQDLSLYYWLTDLLPSFITVVDAFPEGELTLPTVSVERLNLRSAPYEMGGVDKDTAIWRIDVFAHNKSQRDDLAYTIFYNLENNVAVNDYDEGFPPDVTPTQLGVLRCFDRQIQPIKVFEELVRTLYWRSAINFWTEYEVI